MINVLIRVSRVKEFQNCIESIKCQLFRDIRIITAVDNQELVPAVAEILAKTGLPCDIIIVENNGKPYNWNLYCNALKSSVKDGWFFYLDDDDCLSDKFSLQQIRKHLSEEHGTICQFLRNNKPKPNFARKFWMEAEHIVRGRIGGSCIFLHHSHKNVAHWDDERAADYRFMRDVQKAIPLRFVPVVVVKALNSGRHGK